MRELLAHYAEILTDPAHALVEFTFVLIDVVIIQRVGAGLKRFVKREHLTIDAEHGVTHEEV